MKKMNYGFAVGSDSGHSIKLTEEESERVSYQLYYFMATGLKRISNLYGLDVVGMDSGR